MPRPVKCRKICGMPDYVSFWPEGSLPGQNVSGKSVSEGSLSGDPALRDTVVLQVDEFETLRLLDYEGLTQEECAAQMNVVRTTVTKMYESARRKVVTALVEGRHLLIAGGNFHIHAYELDESLKKKGDHIMRVAVTWENGEIFQHFGHTQQFKVYDIEDGGIKAEKIVDTNGVGHGALAGFLNEAKADVLICGGIGGGARMALEEAGVKLYGRVSGSADEAVKAFLNHELVYNPDVSCDHHGHGHEGHNCH